MDERELTGRVPGEVVEVYRQREHREVVECYTRPLPTALLPKPVTVSAPQLPKKRSKRGFVIFLCCLAVMTLLALVGWFFTHYTVQVTFPGSGPSVHMEEARGEITIPVWSAGQGAELEVVRETEEQLPIQEIYRRVNPSVVGVMAQLDRGASVGTGVIFTEDGYILTNYHVVAGGSMCLVILEDGYQYEAMYVAGDEKCDLAVLKIEETGLPAAVFGDSDSLVVGDPVYAIGNPLGMELRGTLTDGIVSAINRDVVVDGQTMTVIQTNAALNTGNSGGPLINQYGRVVGINTAKMSIAQRDSASVEGLGFAIPTATLERVVNDLLTYGEVQPEPLLGISVYNTATRLEEDLWGAGIDSVVPGGAGEKAGLRAGDCILSIDGEEILTSQDVLRARRRYHLGDEMQMTIWRDGEVFDVTLELDQAAE